MRLFLITFIGLTLSTSAFAENCDRFLLPDYLRDFFPYAPTENHLVKPIEADSLLLPDQMDNHILNKAPIGPLIRAKEIWIATHTLINFQTKLVEVLNQRKKPKYLIALASSVWPIRSEAFKELANLVLYSHGGEFTPSTFIWAHKEIHLVGGYLSICLHATLRRLLHDFESLDEYPSKIIIHGDLSYVNNNGESAKHAHLNFLKKHSTFNLQTNLINIFHDQFGENNFLFYSSRILNHSPFEIEFIFRNSKTKKDVKVIYSDRTFDLNR
jgi:hypothetical protein